MGILSLVSCGVYVYVGLDVTGESRQLANAVLLCYLQSKWVLLTRTQHKAVNYAMKNVGIAMKDVEEMPLLFGLMTGVR